MANSKFESAMPFEYVESKTVNNVNLKSIIAGMKTLLKVFRYDMKISIEENNEIPSNIRIEINIKNIR